MSWHKYTRQTVIWESYRTLPLLKLFGFPIFRFWAYLMMVIWDRRYAH